MPDINDQKEDILPPLSEDDKMVAALCYPFWFGFSPWILLTEKKRELFLYFHALQSLYFGAATSVFTLVSSLFLYLIFFHTNINKISNAGPQIGQMMGCGFISILALTIFCLVLPCLLFFSLWCAWKASTGRIFRIPVIGSLAYTKVSLRRTEEERQYLESLTKTIEITALSASEAQRIPTLPQRYEDREGAVSYAPDAPLKLQPGIDLSSYRTPDGVGAPDARMVSQLTPAIEQLKTIFSQPEEPTPELPEELDFNYLDAEVPVTGEFGDQDFQQDTREVPSQGYLQAQQQVRTQEPQTVQGKPEDDRPLTPLERLTLLRKQQTDEKKAAEPALEEPPKEEYLKKLESLKNRDAGKKAKLLLDENQMKIQDQLNDLYAPTPPASKKGEPGKSPSFPGVPRDESPTEDLEKTEGAAIAERHKSPFDVHFSKRPPDKKKTGDEITRQSLLMSESQMDTIRRKFEERLRAGTSEEKSKAPQESVGGTKKTQNGLSGSDALSPQEHLALLRKRFDERLKIQDIQTFNSVQQTSDQGKQVAPQQTRKDLSPEEHLNLMRQKFEERQKSLVDQSQKGTSPKKFPPGLKPGVPVSPSISTGSDEGEPQQLPTSVLSQDDQLELMRRRFEEQQKKQEPDQGRRLFRSWQSASEQDQAHPGTIAPNQQKPVQQGMVTRIQREATVQSTSQNVPVKRSPDAIPQSGSQPARFLNEKEQLEQFKERFSPDTAKPAEKPPAGSPLQVLSQMQQQKKAREPQMSEEERQHRARSILEKMEANLQSIGPRKLEPRKIIPELKPKGTSFLSRTDDDEF